MRTSIRATIYGLFDPRNGALRYVGQTKGLAYDRAYMHASMISEKSLKGAWVLALRTFGLYPEYEVIELVEPYDVDEAEEFWIAYYAALGCPLLNETIGGKGYRRRIPKLDAEARLAAMVDDFDHLRLPPRRTLEGA